MSASQAPESPPPPGWEKRGPSSPPRSPSPPPTCPNPPENPDSAPRSTPPHRPLEHGCSPPKKPETPPLQSLEEEGVEIEEPKGSRMCGCEGAGCLHAEQPGAPFLPSAKENADSSGQGRSISPPPPPSGRERAGDVEVCEPTCSPPCSKRKEASCGTRSQNRETETSICPRESNSPGRERQTTPTRVSSPKKLKTSPQLPQTLPPLPPPQEMGQMVCGSCDELLSFPKTALLVKCPCCQIVNFVLEEHQVGNVKCGRCSVLLMYPYGSPSVRCSCCRFVTKILPQNERPPLSVQRGHPPLPSSTPY